MLGTIKEPGTNYKLRRDEDPFRTNDTNYFKYATIRAKELLRVGWAGLPFPQTFLAVLFSLYIKGEYDVYSII
jgi:hypothetical protein